MKLFFPIPETVIARIDNKDNIKTLLNSILIIPEDLFHNPSGIISLYRIAILFPESDTDAVILSPVWGKKNFCAPARTGGSGRKNFLEIGRTSDSLIPSKVSFHWKRKVSSCPFFFFWKESPYRSWFSFWL